MNVKFPDWAQDLFKPKRYKVFWGGRGSSKSWSFARALLILAASKPMRVLCTREVQKSIKDSVHRLLADQIESMGLGAQYDILESEIRGKNGSLFLFAGLQSHTVESIKSYEGVDIVWCEEAHKISRKSWSILIPTIRKPGSEIWVSFNPELDTDETYQRFVVNTPPDSVVKKVNYTENPWFPEVLEAERKHAKETLPKDEYENIWEGKCRAAAEGAIYADEIIAAIEGKRIANVPYDPALKVHVVVDLGWNDAMSIIMAQRSVSELRIVDYIEDSHKTLDWYSAELKNRRYNWGKLFLPHDGRHGNLQTGKSAEQIMRGLGWDVVITPNIAVESGIKQARMAFPRCYFDKEKVARLVECLKRYRRHISQSTSEPSQPVHDEYSHGADAFRYLAINIDSMKNETFRAINYSNKGIV